MDPTEQVDRALRGAQELKSTIVRRDGVGSEIPPMLTLFHEGQLLGAIALIGERDEVMPAITAAIAMSGCDVSSHITEAYVLTGPDVEQREREGEYGDLAPRFAAGDPNVCEALCVFVFTRDEEHAQALMPFTYDGRNVVWLDNEARRLAIAADEVQGAIPDAVRAGYEQQVPNVRVPVPAISITIGMPSMTPFTAPPPRNGPCPCGSGRKSKHCCWETTR